MPEYSIGRLRGGFALVFYDAAGKRHRHALGTSDAGEADRRAPAVYASLIKPTGTRVSDLWAAYAADKAGRVIVTTMSHTWKAISPRFGTMQAGDITVQDCRAYIAGRRKAKIKDGSILTELNHLRTVLNWSVKQNLIDRAPHIERPSAPKPKDRYLTRTQAAALIRSASMPHLRLFIVLALGTGARNAAILGLTWDRCDFSAGMIDLRDPDRRTPSKGRAIVPMNRTVRAALLDARPSALTDHVIEWAGRPVAAVKRGLAESARRAGVGHVSPHLLRHSAAVHLAEAGHSMEEIAQYLGHANSRITAQVYARFSPDYLRTAAAALEYDDIGSMNQRTTSRKKAKS